jgi:thiamine phosphate synthase YjbQ (UPF0047 family)
MSGDAAPAVRFAQETIAVPTRGRGLVDVTGAIARCVADSGIRAGPGPRAQG